MIYSNNNNRSHSLGVPCSIAATWIVQALYFNNNNSWLNGAMIQNSFMNFSADADD